MKFLSKFNNKKQKHSKDNVSSSTPTHLSHPKHISIRSSGTKRLKPKQKQEQLEVQMPQQKTNSQNGDDFQISLQQKMTEQHQFFLTQALKLLQQGIDFYKQFQSKYASLSIPLALNLESYLLDEIGSIPAHHIQPLIKFISDRPSLQRFLQTVVDCTPKLFMDQLILIAYRTILSYFPLMCYHLDDNQLQILSHDRIFMWNVYCDANISVFSYNKIELVNGQSNIGAFMRSYALTILLILQNYAANPAFQKQKQNGKQIKENCKTVTERQTVNQANYDKLLNSQRPN